MSERAAELDWRPESPQTADLSLQRIQVGAVAVSELALHPIPQVLNWIEIRGIARPVNDFPLFLSQPPLDRPGNVRPSTILEKPLGAGSLHCRLSAAPEDLQVAVLVWLK